VIRVGDRFKLKSITEDDIDAEEYIRNLKHFENTIEQMEQGLKDAKENLKTFLKYKKDAESLRDKEVNKAKQERQSYMG
jgi:hypothetical protein